jgi:hypothetical protein
MNKYVKLVESLITEKAVDTDEFPFVKGKQLSSKFLTKGQRDGSANDDKVSAKQVTLKAEELQPSQSAIFTGKSVGMAVTGMNGGDLKAIISKDNAILDGHHRWLATMLNGANGKSNPVSGVKVDINIGDLIPVLRSVGNALGNEQRGEPKGGDVSIFKATLKDVQEAARKGSKFFTPEQGEAWLKKLGDANIVKRLKTIQTKYKPHPDAPPRIMMPVIDADKGQVALVAKKLKNGDIDVYDPYKADNENEESGKSDLFRKFVKKNANKVKDYNHALTTFNNILKKQGKVNMSKEPISREQEEDINNFIKNH